MKKISLILLFLLLITSCLTFTGCQNKVDISDHIIHGRTRITKSDTTNGRVWHATYYVNLSKFDVSTAEKIEVVINGKKIIASPSSSDNTFDVTVTDPDYEWTGLSVDSCYAHVSKSEASKTPSNETVGSFFLYGIIMVVVCSVIHLIGVVVNSAFIAGAPGVISLILTVGTYISYGVGRGIIMTVFLAIYIFIDIEINKHFLDYDGIL